ncbi:hypothetical protein VTK56DRAFT_3810 [Thermocarpiscus australiensis]
MELDDGYSDGDPEDEGRDDGPLPPLGLLNGRYEVRCTGPPPYLENAKDGGIIFTLDGDALWGSFDIFPYTGVLRLDELPWCSSLGPLYFEWRGENLEAGLYSGTNGGSFLKFLGDGKIVGKIYFCFMFLNFEGERISGPGARSEISAFSMREQWEQLRR